jgi:very-short-patch-repair endonuclease
MADDKPIQYTSSADQWDKLKPRARELRHKATTAEDVLWQAIRNRRLNGVKFRRQHAVDTFIADFVCIERRLIIEVDGAIHEESAQLLRDHDRQLRLEGLGYRVLRFTNAEVLSALSEVLQVIGAALDSASNSVPE